MINSVVCAPLIVVKEFVRSARSEAWLSFTKLPRVCRASCLRLAFDFGYLGESMNEYSSDEYSSFMRVCRHFIVCTVAFISKRRFRFWLPWWPHVMNIHRL